MSKYSGVFQTQQEPLQSFEPAAESVAIVQPVKKQSVATVAAKLGRPRAKRSDPDYCQVTAYIRRKTYQNVRIKLMQQGDTQEFSELVENLLAEFLRTQKSNNART